jgi:hypothetical protein
MIDDIYKLCPPLFTMGVLRCYSPTSKRREHYEEDTAFFKAHPKRRLMIRPAMFSEFDIELQLGDWLSVPHIHLLIVQVSIGVHLAVPVYRGRSFFEATVETDAEVGLILSEMARRNGFDEAEWVAFEKTHTQAVKAYQTMRPEVIH